MTSIMYPNKDVEYTFTAKQTQNITMFQLGAYSKKDQKIRAWRVTSTFGYTFEKSGIKPRVYFNIDVASGDRDSSDHTLNTFIRLIPISSIR